MSTQSKLAQESSQFLPSLALNWYLSELTAHPLRTKAVTSGILSGLQEYIAQELSGSRKRKLKQIEKKTIFGSENNERVVKMVIYGFFISGPLGHFLFQTLNKVFAGRTTSGAKLLQIIASNLIISPIQNAVFLAAMAIIGGVKTPAHVYGVVRDSLWKLMRISWVVSPLTMAYAQRYLEPKLWVPFFNLVGFIFGVVANTKAKRVQQQKNRDREIQEIQKETEKIKEETEKTTQVEPTEKEEVELDTIETIEKFEELERDN
ncbi:13398_t:CDS:2 [Ambispora leptoticha]|uniref:13398_t:CDS:1 n=1 Tax=Ambispora leptoticha TaxID=144679 RepID=A0A9N9CWF7_9GLOM|nr:13398_t:CDS:2 [Ambispora leptoticha]